MFVPTLTIEIPYTKIKDFCQQYQIQKLSLFGSVLRADFSEQSDLDFLVEFVPERTPGFFTISQMEQQLSEMMNGRKVDLRTPQELSHYFRDRVLQEAKVIYDIN